MKRMSCLVVQRGQQQRVVLVMVLPRVCLAQQEVQMMRSGRHGSAHRCQGAGEGAEGHVAGEGAGHVHQQQQLLLLLLQMVRGLRRIPVPLGCLALLQQQQQQGQQQLTQQQVQGGGVVGVLDEAGAAVGVARTWMKICQEQSLEQQQQMQQMLVVAVAQQPATPASSHR